MYHDCCRCSGDTSPRSGVGESRASAELLSEGRVPGLARAAVGCHASNRGGRDLAAAILVRDDGNGQLEQELIQLEQEMAALHSSLLAASLCLH